MIIFKDKSVAFKIMKVCSILLRSPILHCIIILVVSTFQGLICVKMYLETEKINYAERVMRRIA